MQVQGLVAVLIVSNFIINIIQGEITSVEGSTSEQTFSEIDLFFTLAFLCELLFNMLGSWFWPFIRSLLLFFWWQCVCVWD